ncbi:MAG: sterol desaturase family protein [Hyphomicrobiales bacterium]|nr:sterol desaturase family protein [Hyphomicrobiales bacterium]MDE2016290.1 sterol desaturase family protein [Hyphomicrobiales bacterium]
MDDLLFGARDKRGDWKPKEPAVSAPLFRFPPSPAAILRWLPHYFLPYNVAWAASAYVWWRWVIPDPQTTQTLGFAWIARLFAINCLAVLTFYGGVELRLYWRRTQATRFKYDARWPAERRDPTFFFGRQDLDNALRTFVSGMPIWTGVEVLLLHAFAAGWVPTLHFADHPVYFAALALFMPVLHETHFYLVHRAIHWPPLYARVHRVHHNSINASPWSSLSMHPVEHLAYFAVALWHLVLPSNPLMAIYQLHYAGFGAIVGHVGFDKIEVGADAAIDSHAYIHYLHHKHFEVNYGDGLVPFDRWFGTFHDGSAQGEAAMQARWEKKRALAKAKEAAKAAR